jgi:hypothetical protein
MNNKHIVAGIFCNLSKVFDCVKQNPFVKITALWNMRTFGALIKSYHMERYQKVAIRNKTKFINYSHWEVVRHGVPPGSILGPLLFLLYINKLPLVRPTKPSWCCMQMIPVS